MTLAVMVVGLGMAGVRVQSQPGAGAWATTAPMARGHGGPHSSVLLTGPRCARALPVSTCGQVLVAGGAVEADGSQSRVSELYNPVTRTFTRTTGDMVSPEVEDLVLLGGPACASRCGMVLAVGQPFAGILAQLYDPETGRWSSAVGQPSIQGRAVALANSKVLLIRYEFRTAQVYDPATNTWSLTGQPKFQHGNPGTATLLIGSGCADKCGQVLLVGGFDTCCGTTVGMPTAELFDPDAVDAETGRRGEWKRTGDLNMGRAYHAAAQLANGKVLVAGGIPDATVNRPAFSSAELYDPATGAWAPTGSLIREHMLGTANLLDGGQVLLAGGYELRNGLQPATVQSELYNPEAGIWSPTGPLNQPRGSHATTLLGDATVLATGGFQGFPPAPGGRITSAEIYTPAPAVNLPTTTTTTTTTTPPGSPAPAKVSVADTSQAEGDSANTTATFRVTLATKAETAVAVDYATIDGTAKAGSDYVAAKGRVSFAVGELTKNIDVGIIADTVGEADEAFRVALSKPEPNGTELARAEAVGTILDDDRPRLSITSVSVPEGTLDAAAAEVKVTLDSAGVDPVSLDYATANGSAKAGSDYVASKGGLVFAPGELAKTIEVPIIADSAVEPDEVFEVVASKLVNANSTGLEATVTILDDDALESPLNPANVGFVPPGQGIGAGGNAPAPGGAANANTAGQQSTSSAQSQATAQAQAPAQAQAQAQALAPAQAQAQVAPAGVMVERQRETETAGAYLASARSRPASVAAPAFGFVAAMLGLGLGLGLAWRSNDAPSQAFDPPPSHLRSRRRRRHDL